MSIISDTETFEQEQELYIVLSDTTTETTEVSVTTEGTDSELYVS